MFGKCLYEHTGFVTQNSLHKNILVTRAIDCCRFLEFLIALWFTWQQQIFLLYCGYLFCFGYLINSSENNQLFLRVIAKSHLYLSYVSKLCVLIFFNLLMSSIGPCTLLFARYKLRESFLVIHGCKLFVSNYL